MPPGAVLALVAVAGCVAGLDLAAHLATSTPYRPRAAAAPAPETVAAAAAAALPAPTCRLLQANMLLRHGTRHPTAGTIRAAADLHRRLRAVLARQPAGAAPAWLAAWRPQFDAGLAGELTPAGVLEHYRLARRLARRHPAVFARPYRERRCRLRSTQKSRAGRSASAFAFGLWHGTGDLSELQRFQPTFIATTGPVDDDAVLRPFDRCPRYARVRSDPDTTRHHRDYMRRISAEVADSIERRLGVRLGPELIAPTWKVVRGELSALGASNLAALFAPGDVLALELADDIAAFWAKGPGRPVNWQMTCPLLRDIVASMAEAAADAGAGDNDDDDDDGQHRYLDLRFAHAETLIPLVTSLGLFQDNLTLTSESDASQLGSRLWRMSHVSPYAANVAFHLYRCGDEFLVSILHNEEPVPIAFCSDKYFCPLTTFEAHFRSLTSFCNLTEICSLDNPRDACKAEHDRSTGRQAAPWLAFIATTVGLALGALTGFFIHKSPLVLAADSRDPAYHRLTD